MVESYLVMYSGGRDSLLATCRLLDAGKRVVLVHFDNGCMLYPIAPFYDMSVKRIIDIYGEEMVSYFGDISIAPLWRELSRSYFNMPANMQVDMYGELIPSQVHCLICKVSMYAYAIKICKQECIQVAADGAKEYDQFGVQRSEMRAELCNWFHDNGLTLEFPLIDECPPIRDDYSRDNELMARGLIPKVCETKCLVGTAMNEPLSDRQMNAIIEFYKKGVVPKLKEFEIYGENYVIGNRWESSEL